MTFAEAQEERLLAYALDDLEAEERRSVEDWLAADPAARRRVAETRAFHEVMRGEYRHERRARAAAGMADPPTRAEVLAALRKLKPGEDLREALHLTRTDLDHESDFLDEVEAELLKAPSVDAVTGVWNRFEVHERLVREWSRSKRHEIGIACLLVGLDGLEEVRQLGGSTAGDHRLRAVAEVLRSLIRDHDILGRHKGDRFVLVALHCTRRGAGVLAERISNRVQNLPPNGIPTKLKASVGICTDRAGGVEIVEDLLEAAEEALETAGCRSVPIAFSSGDAEDS